MNSSSSDDIGSKPNKKLYTRCSGRIEWIDYAKGITIFLVVYSHVLIGIYNSNFDIYYPFYIHSIKFMYSFHMPVFFLLSGIFAIKSSSIPFSNFLLKKLKTIIYPYLLWSLIQGCIYALMSPFTNFKFNFGELPSTIAFYPLMQLWFLYVLFFIHILFFFINKISGKYNYHILFTTAFIMYFLSGYITIHVVSKVSHFFLFYVLGAILSLEFNFTKYLNLNRLQILCFAITLAIAQFMIVDLNGRIDYIGNPLQSLFLACIGIVFVISTSIYISKKQNMRFILDIGKLSLPIYLMHILAIVGFRIILNKIFGINDILVHILIGTLVGLWLPIITYRLVVNKMQLFYLFSL